MPQKASKKTLPRPRLVRWRYVGSKTSPEQIRINGQNIGKGEVFKLPAGYDFTHVSGGDLRIGLHLVPVTARQNLNEPSNVAQAGEDSPSGGRELELRLHARHPYLRIPRHSFLVRLIEAAYLRDSDNRSKIEKLERMLAPHGGSLTEGPVFECLEDAEWLHAGFVDPHEATDALRKRGKLLKSQLRGLSRAIKILEQAEVSGTAIEQLEAERRYIERSIPPWTFFRSIFHNVGLRTIAKPISLENLFKEGRKTPEKRFKAKMKLLLAICAHRLIDLGSTQYKVHFRIIPLLVEIFYPQHKDICKVTSPDTRRSAAAGSDGRSYRSTAVFETYKNRFKRGREIGGKSQ
jgi:hypothetical protein